MDDCHNCRDMRAHVEKLTEMLDTLNPCSESCDVIAFGAWVDPSDLKRVREMRSLLIGELETASATLFAISVTSLEMHERVRAFAKRGHEKAFAALEKMSLGRDTTTETKGG